MIRIQVRLFAALRDALGQTTMTLQLPPGATAADALAAVAASAAPKPLPQVTLAVNRRHADGSSPLCDGDEVALLPPVSGGAAPCFEITAAPIGLDDVAQRVSAPAHGAITLFAGVVRGVSAAQQTDHLEYEAYAEMAVASFEQIADEVRMRWPAITAVAIVHRVGRLEVGETSIAIAIAAAHRQDTFDGCSYVIERVKAVSPIWKKEVGPDGAYWVEGPRGG